MPSTAEVTREHFDAVGRQDLAAMGATWAEGGTSRLVGLAELEAPAGVVEWFSELFGCFPDFKLTIDETVVEGETSVARWTADATFDGSGTFEGFKPNGARIRIEGMDILTIRDSQIQTLIAFLNGLDLARQIGAVPPAGSAPDKAMAAAFNAKTAISLTVKKLRSS